MRSVVRAEQALLASLHFVLNIGKAKQICNALSISPSILKELEEKR
jgi:hypothetical protein